MLTSNTMKRNDPPHTALSTIGTQNMVPYAGGGGDHSRLLKGS